MGADKFEADFFHWLSSNAKSIDRGVVLGDEKTVACFHLWPFLTGIKRLETSGFKDFYYCFCGQEVNWRSVKEVQKILYHDGFGYDRRTRRLILKELIAEIGFFCGGTPKSAVSLERWYAEIGG